jgi:hypothetical protein
MPSGERPAPSVEAIPRPLAGPTTLGSGDGRALDTRTKLSAESRKAVADENEAESVASQDVPAVANSERTAGEGPLTRRSGANEPSSTNARSRRGTHLVLALGGVAATLGLLWQLGKRQAARTAPTPSATVAPQPARNVVISIESTPPGAHVTEQGRELGTTPFKLSVVSGAETDRPRTFVLSLPGYRSHVFERAAGPEATYVRVDLVREPAAESAPPFAAVSAAPAPWPAANRPAPRARPQHPPSQPSKPESAPDIRLVR